MISHFLRSIILLVCCCPAHQVISQIISGELMVWHKVTLTFDGPMSSEQASPNPFFDFRMTVTFTHDGAVYAVPGYFAADGNAANSGADSGNQWRVHFAPDRVGEWHYSVSFRQGADIAISENEGIPVAPDGTTGSFIIEASNKTGVDFRSKGRLAYVQQRYLRHLGSGAYFLKTGTDSPETLLACRAFDQTSMISTGAPLKDWLPHVGDWQTGDPVWRDSLGKGIIGAINYLAEEEQNAISFLTMNIHGDGDNVWPFADPMQFDRFDCSKLDQWEIVFEHCDHKGIYLHFKTQEEENDQLLDEGELGRIRKLYYREHVARFAHHLALNWNLGEENSNTTDQRKAFAQFIRALDPYDHLIVVHTFPGSDEIVYTPLLGDQSVLTGASLQGDWSEIHQLTLTWVNNSQSAGKPWIVSNDEQGIAFIGVPDGAYPGVPTQKDIRASVLWGNLMAGGAGVEYYFGYALPHNDLNCEDFRSRDRIWDFNRYAKQFFEKYVPFWLMQSSNSLVQPSEGKSYCLALEDSVYIVYLSDGGPATLDLTRAHGEFEVVWYNPREGKELVVGETPFILGGQVNALGLPPNDVTEDWVCLIQKKTDIPGIKTLDCAPFDCSTSTLIWKYDLANTLTPSIEASYDGENFEMIVPFDAIHCTEYCTVHVPALSSITSYRLNTANVYSNTVRSHVPCFGHKEGMSIEHIPHMQGQSN